MNKSDINIPQINKTLINHFGKPKRKLDSKPLDVLIATILSQNTNDRNSHKAYFNLKSKFPKWSDLEKAKASQIAASIRPAGLNKQKAKTIKLFFKWLSNNHTMSLKHLNRLSDDEIISQLTSIPGIGVKTASCVLLFGMRRNVCPVDTHVFRTVNRIGIVKEPTPDKTYFALNAILPNGIAHEFHTNLIMLGRTICKPANPHCVQCPLLKFCKFSDKILIEPSNMLGKKKNDFFLLDEI